jgi:hypothetical protein
VARVALARGHLGARGRRGGRLAIGPRERQPGQWIESHQPGGERRQPTDEQESGRRGGKADEVRTPPVIGHEYGQVFA